MNFNYFDIHSHLNLKPLYENRADILARMRELAVGTITVGTDYETSKLAIELAEENPDILWATVGIHPNDNLDEVFDYKKYLELAKHEKVVAIGECGLDYFRLPENEDEIKQIKERQKEIFKKQIEIAIEVQKPLMIHARPSKGTQDAYEDVLGILAEYNIQHTTYKLSVNFHFFVGDIEIAKQIVSNGWTMSFDGPITFSRDYDEVIRSIPLENIMSETDAPFAAPEPYRSGKNLPTGKQACEPWMVSEIAKKIAEIKDISLETVQNTLRDNIKRTFDI